MIHVVEFPAGANIVSASGISAPAGSNSRRVTGTVGGQPFPGTVLNNTSSMYALSLDEIRELAVLHELFHVHDGGIFDDNTGDVDRDLMYTRAINRLIRRECGFR